MLITGFIFLFIGIALLYWINRRKFNRRGTVGIEEFKSYENAMIIRIIERIGKWFGYILIALGILYFWRYSRHTDENKNIVEKAVPVTIGKFNAKQKL
ncbi:molybdenum ABC transporter permease [Chryseobacterium indologenes]|uniref:molybdenum ABC transporter permease n=1 Tax=Chryseobacterium indologenes TaxID=253 RepID=UPI001E4CA355|nr:molybdenum ABC transporter permease [Chryseobacterium indologenes]